MSAQSDIQVMIDDRVRLLSAALAATHYPQMAQERKRHQPHAHARATTKYMKDRGHHQHPAIRDLQTMLDKGIPIETIFTLVMHCGWPGLKIAQLPKWVPAGWHQQLWDFYEAAQLEAYWNQENKLVWDQAHIQAQNVFKQVSFKDFMQPFFGEINEDFVFMPNIGYPADREVGIRVGKQLIAITPPPLAWGESPPWPYDEDTLQTHSIRAAMNEYGRLLLMAYLRKHADQVAEAAKKELPVSEQLKATHPTWEDQFIALFIAGAVAIYLEDHVSAVEAKAYLMMERKTRNMTILPGTISVMRRYLQEYGNKYASLVDFLPVFPMQLRVAKKIVSM